MAAAGRRTGSWWGNGEGGRDQGARARRPGQTVDEPAKSHASANGQLLVDGEQVRGEQAAQNADGALKDRDVDVAVEVDAVVAADVTTSMSASTRSSLSMSTLTSAPS